MGKKLVWLVATLLMVSCGDDDMVAPTGDLISEISGPDFTTTFRYNGLNQLIEKVTEGDLREEEAYIYNGRGQVVNITTTTTRAGDVVAELACGFVWDGDQLVSRQCLAFPNNIRFTDEFEWNSDGTTAIEARIGGSGSTTHMLSSGNLTSSLTVDVNAAISSELLIAYVYDGSPTFDVDVFGPDNYMSSQINAHPSALTSRQVRDLNADLQVITEREVDYEFVLIENRVVSIIESGIERRIENDVLISEEEQESTINITYRN